MAETVRKTRTFLGRREAPCRTTIKKLVKKFELLGQVNDVKNKTRARRSRIAENIADLQPKTQVCPFLVALWNQALDLSLQAYKVHLTQELKPADHQRRRIFGDQVVEMH